MRSMSLFLFSLFSITPPLAAQCAPSGYFGHQVRIRWMTGTIEGVLVQATPESLFVDAYGDTLRISCDALQNLAVATRYGSNAGQGAGIGAIAGSVLGGLIAAITFEPPPPCTGWFCFDFPPHDAGEAFLMGAAAGGLVGVVVGAVIGSKIPRYRWRQITFEPLRVAPLRSRGYAAVGATLRW